MSRDIAEVPSVEIISTAALHLMSAAAVHLGLAEDLPEHRDLDEARVLIDALAGLLDASAPSLGHHHAAPLRDGLRSLQLAFQEASDHPRRARRPAPARSTPARSTPQQPDAADLQFKVRPAHSFLWSETGVETTSEKVGVKAEPFMKV